MATFSFHPALKGDVNVPATLDFGKPFVPQVQKILESAGPGLMNREGEVTISGQAVAAILMVAGLEMVRGLPLLTLYSIGQQVERVGVLDLSDYRHNQVRSHRGEVPDGEAFTGYTVLDGSGRGISSAQMAELATILSTDPDKIRVLNANVGQVDWTNPTVGMVDGLLAKSLTKADWAGRRVLYLPAGAGLAAVVQATAIHGLSESWPKTIRLAKGDDGGFHVVEVCDPQDMRQWGTQIVARWTADRTAETLAMVAEAVGFAEVDGNTITFAIPGGPTVKISATSAEIAA